MAEEIVTTEPVEEPAPQATEQDSTWSYTAPKVEAQNLDAGNIAADADGVIVKGETESETGTKNQGEGGEDKGDESDESKPEA